MAKKLGTIKSISGSAEVIAVDKSGNQRVLKVGDSLYEGETVKTTSADSKVVIATNNGKELSMIGEDTLSLDPRATAGDSQVAALQKALLNGANLEDLEETAAGGNSGGRGDGMSLGETRFEHGGHYSNISASTSAINPLGAASFAGPAEGKSGGLDSGRGGSDDDTAGAGNTINPETTRKPSNPEIKFPEDTNKDGKISDDENKAGDKDAGKTTVEVTIPKDGSVKPGDKVVVTDDNGKKTEKPINQDDIDKGKIDIPVDLNPGKDNNVTAEIINPNNPNNPGKDSKVIGEDSENTKAPEAPVINEVIDDAKGYGEDTKVGNVLDVKGHLTNDKTPTIKGTAKAGSKVEIYDNGDKIGETTAKSNGSWEFTAPELTKQGEHKFTATAENKFGKSTPSNEATIDLDSIAPKLDNVKITPIDTNSKADDTAELTMGTGHTDTPNAEILFRDENNNIIGKGHANSAGDFLIQLDKAVQPGTPVFVQAIDKAGNAGTDMATAGNIEHPNDHTVPKVDIDTVTPVDTNNPSDGTPDKGIVKGKSDEPNAPVVVTDESGKTIGTGTTDDKGNFEITTDPIKPGDKVKVEVTDKAGHKGSDTETAGDTEILHKDLPEAPVINEVIDDAKGYGEDTKVGNVLDVKGHLTNDKTPTIKGTAKAGSKVEIYDNGDKIGETTAKSNGSWEFTAPELTKQGEHKFTATAENKFGKSTPSNEATIDLDSIAPKLDNVKITPIDTNSRADDTAELTMGTGHTDTPNAEILFRDENNNIIGKGHANSSGDFLIQLDKAVQPGTPVFVQAIDKAGNAGTDMAVAGNIEHPNDTKGPDVNIDTVTPVDETNPSDGTPDKGIVKGKSDEPNAPVVVTDENGKTIGTGTTDDKGNFEITTDPIKPGDKVKVEVTDKAGHKGSDTETAGDTEFVDNTPPSVEVKEVTPVDTNNPADGNPDKGIVKGHSDEPNAPVVVKDRDGKIIGTGTTDDKGDFEINTDPIKPGDKVNVEVTDKAGNKGNGEGTAGNTDFTDKTAPDAPVITEVIDDVKGGKFNEDVKGGTTNDSTPTFKGTAEAGSTITLKNGNDIIAENIPVKADGSWEFTPKSPLVEGEYNITATATDKAGNVSNASNVATVTIDLHTSKPVINEIIDNVEGDTGNVKNERIGWTNDNTPTLKGSAEAGATVDVYVDGRKAGSVKANEKGEWEYTTDKLSDGKHSFYAIATDEAGNVSENSGISWIKVDTNPGEVVITRITDDNGDDALNGAYEGAMKDNTPTIWGTGEQYATVTVSVKDSSGKVVWSDEVYIEDSLGDWHIDVPVALKDGDYTVEASMQDYVKNPVQNSNVVSLTIDNATDKPVIKEIIDNVEGDTGDISSKNNWTNDNTPTLKGSAEAGADIKVFVDGKIAGTTKAGLDGSWEFTPRTKLSDGDHTFYVEATDKIGNKNTSDIETIKVDTNPGKVVITSVTDDNGDDALNGAYEGATKDNTPTINGFAEPYSTVTVSVKDSSGKVVWSGEVYVEDSLGDWSITVDKPLNDGDYTVEASMQDYVKNPVQNSNVVSLTVDTATNIPEIKEIVDNVAGGVENGDVKGKVTNDNTPTLKGSAEAGADIKVFVDGKIAGTTKAGLDGSWEFTPRTKLGDGEHKFVVEATDKLGHSAKSVEASVDVDTTIGNPKVRFVEDTNNDGVLSVAEVAAIKDGKAHWVIDIPTDGSVKAGDVIQSIDGKGNWVKFVEITDEMIKDGRFEATFNVGINKLKDGKYETPEYRFADEAGNVSDSSKASLSLDSEFSRKPSNPEIKFPEDTNKDGKISDDENKANDNDAGKTTVEVAIPKDGSVKPGDKVVVTDDNGKKTEKPINQDDIDKGKIDIPVDLNPGKDNNVTAEIINPNNPNNPGKDSKVIGEASSTVKVTIDEIIDDVKGYGEDTKVGNILDVKGHLTNDNLPTFKGSAALGATVEIYESFYTTTEKTLVGKTVADANGKWSFTPTEAMGDGEHYFEAVATDKVGNKSTSDRVSLDVDTFADAPVIDAVNDNVDSQTGNVLDAKTKVALTNDSTPTLEGYAEPDSVITIYEISELNGEKTAIGTVTADNHGGWKFELPELGDGEYKYTTRAQDKAGNISDFSEVVVVNADLIAPSEPTITFVEDVNPKDGKLNKAENGKDGDSTSTKAQISVPGDAEENDVIHYTVNGEEKTHTITYNDRVTGYVEIKVPVVDGKASSVTAKIVDQAGNASKEVSSSIDSDFTAPNVKITGIIDNVEGGVYKGNVAGTNTNDNKPTIKGTADANQEVVLYDNNKEFGRVTADKDGNWEFKPSNYKEPLADLVGRVHVIKAVVTDAAGNTSEATSALEVDTTIGAPKVSIKEDADHNGVLSVEEAKNLKDSKIHWEVEIPKDGTVSAGDVLQVLGKDGKWKTEKVLSNDDLGKSFEYEATLSGKHFESPSYRIVDLVGNQSTAIHANVQLDSEFSRKPSNPSITFPEDTNKDGKISDDENKAGDKDAGKTTVEVTIPKDGSVKPGDKVVVTDDNGKKTEKPINQDDIDKGKIDIPVDLNPGKDNNVTAEIINPNNPNNPGKDSKVIGEASSTVKVTIDEIIDDVTGGVVNGDVKNGLTNDNLPTFKGSAAPGATVEIYESFYTTTEKTLVGKTVADANGKWSFTPTEAMGDGEHYFEAVATDKVGNKSTSDRVSLDVDTFADAPVIDAVNDNVDSQTGNVLDAKTKVALTNDSTPTLEGYAEPDSVITIYEISELNGEKTAIGTVTADNHGGWKFELPELGDGEYKYTTRAQDKAGNISDFSEVVVVNADLIAPSEPTITFVEDVNPKDGKLNKAENGKDGDSTSTKAQISVPGDAEENDVIHYTVNGEEKTHTITYNDRVTGYVEIKVPVVDGKASSVTAKIVDQAGNASKEVSSSIDSDFTAPNVKITGIIDNVEGGVYKGNVAGTNTNDNKPTIKGTADANQEVVLYDNNKEFGRVTADKDGNWEFKPSNYKEPLADLVGRVHVIKAVVTDAAGNTSEATSALEVDTTIGAPKVSIKEDADNNGVLSVEEAKNLKDSKIHWEVEIPKDGTVSAGDVLQVLGKDGKWKIEKVLSNDDLGKSFEYEATLSGKHFESPSYRIVDLVGNQSTAIHANVQLDSEFSRKPSNPSITFPEDTNKDGKISDDENKAGDKDAGKTTVEVTIPKDGSVKPGDKVVVTDDNGKKTEKPINQDDIDKGKIDIPVDLNPGKDNNVTAEIINPNNPNNPGKDSKVIGEDSENTKAPEAPVITEVIDDVKGGKFNEDVKGGLTNDSTPTFKGTAKPGTTITLKNGNDLIADNIPVKTDGSWEFTIKTPLAQGDYSITATATNAAGKVSAPSDAATIKIDLHSDEPVITEIIDNVAGGVVNGDVKGGLTNDNTPTLKGTAEPFATVEIKIDGRGSYRFENGEVISNWTAVADKDGNWEFTTPKLSDGHHNFEAQATDVAGNNSQPSALVSIDVDTHIDAPVITAVTDNWWGGVENGGNILGVNDGFTNDTTPTFKGTAEAGSTIVLKNGNDIIAEKVVVDADGNWEFTPKSPLAEGEYNVVAIATDKAGNVSNPSNVATVNVDISTTQPVITEIIDDVAGGVVGNVKNALTNDNLPTLKGTAEAFSTVKIIVDDKLVFKDGKEVTVTADKDGNWEYTFEANLNWGGEVHAALEDGVHTLKVQTTDRAGNRSAVSEWSSVDVDTTIGAPTVKITTDINSDKKIDIADASALKDGKLKWVIDIPENTVKAGDRVQILGSDAKTWTDIFKVTAQDIAKGFIERDEFSIDMPKSRGFQTPSYRLVDDAGNVSEGSMDAVKIVGFTPKAPTIIAVLDNEYGIDPKNPTDINAGDTTGNVLEGAIAITNDKTPTLIGKAEAGTTITLKNGDTVIAEKIPVDANGNWHYEPEENSPWADGDYKITAIAKNVFGKESESSSPITVTVDTTGPEVTLTSIEDSVKTNDVVDFTGNVKGKVTNDNTPLLKGTAEAGSVIIIKYGEHHENVVTTKADKNGHWDYKITNPLSDGEHIISYQAVDKAGNTSLEYVANVTVDTKIADAKVEFIEDTNNDGKFSWKENIENTHTGRLSWKALIPDDGSIKAGDIFHYKWDETGWHERAISQAEIDRGYIGEMKNNQIDKDQPDAGKPMPYGKNANGSVYVAEAFFSDAAGNKGAKGSDKVVFDFSDNQQVATTNVKITSIYDDVRGGHVGNLITNEAAQVAGLTNDKTPTISGTAEANASVKVSVVDGKSHSVWEKTITAESDGSWKVTTDDIADGNYSVTAVATNKAGAVSNPYTVSNLEIDTTIAQPNIWIKEDANQDKIYDKADYENPANGNGDITFVVDIPQDRVTIKAGDVFHYMINTNNPRWGRINGYTEDITITEADIKSGSISRVVTLCDDGKDFNMSHDGMIVSMNGYFKDLAGNALSNDTMVRFDLKNTYGGKVRSTRSLPDDILDNDSVDLSNAARINEPKAEPNVLNNNKIGVSANDLLETPKDHIMNEGKSEAKPSYATASSHAGEENIATTHPIQIEEKVENHF